MTASNPVVASLAVLFDEDRVLLVRRSMDAARRFWGFPGGHVDFGEPIARAAARELLEETGVQAQPIEVLPPVDAIIRDRHGAVRAHYALIPVRMRWMAGQACAASDVDEARWVALADLDALEPGLHEHVADIARLAYACSRSPLGCLVTGGQPCDPAG